MANIKNVYKELSTQEANTRASYALTSEESVEATTIITNFISYFKTKHT